MFHIARKSFIASIILLNRARQPLTTSAYASLALFAMEEALTAGKVTELEKAGAYVVLACCAMAQLFPRPPEPPAVAASPALL